MTFDKLKGPQRIPLRFAAFGTVGDGAEPVLAKVPPGVSWFAERDEGEVGKEEWWGLFRFWVGMVVGGMCEEVKEVLEDIERDTDGVYVVGVQEEG